MSREPNDKVMHFGNAITVSTNLVDNAHYPEDLDDTIRRTLMENFDKTRATRFPTWRGVPEIVIHPLIDKLARFRSVSWYVEVPSQYVTDDTIRQLEAAQARVTALEAANQRLQAQVYDLTDRDDEPTHTVNEWGQRRPITIRSTIPRTNDEMQEARLRLGATGWPVIVLDYHWEIIP